MSTSLVLQNINMNQSLLISDMLYYWLCHFNVHHYGNFILKMHLIQGCDISLSSLSRTPKRLRTLSVILCSSKPFQKLHGTVFQPLVLQMKHLNGNRICPAIETIPVSYGEDFILSESKSKQAYSESCFGLHSGTSSQGSVHRIAPSVYKDIISMHFYFHNAL